jgi:hypothetical protein
VVRVISSRRNGEGPKTARRFYYLALSFGFIQPDMGASDAAKKSRDAAYKRVCDILAKLRMAGELAWESVLDLTRELDQWRVYNSPREARARMRETYEEDRWLGQSYYPVLIVEKDTMVPVCRPMAMAWQMPFASSRGYSSLTLQHDVATMLARRWALTQQPPIVYFVSDLDPSGLDLQRAWKEALANFGIFPLFERLALTDAQVRDPELNIDHLAIAVKPSDSRAAKYIAEYGTRCWEVDILPPERIETALDNDIRSWLDAEKWQRRNTEIEQARKLL